MSLPHDLLDRLVPVDRTAAQWDDAFPSRDLPDGALVTRFAPSPTGFVHLGALYTALVDLDLAHHSSGAYFVRIEDTDQLREVAGSDVHFDRAFRHFGVEPTEARDAPWGPYRQSEREAIYHSHVRALLEADRAYPCFATHQELEDITARQRARKIDIGYYGEFAAWRDADAARIEAAVEARRDFVIRFRAPPGPRRVEFTDAVRGRLDMADNHNDVVLLKSASGGVRLPTYHLAHAVDDHLMRVSLVVRGDEWLPSVPLHLQLFDALGHPRIPYAHLAPLMKSDGPSRRKLSKRKDPEASVEFFMAHGHPAGAVRHYLRGLANSRLADAAFRAAADEPLRLEEFGTAGPLVDLDKLDHLSAEYVAQLPADEIRELLAAWSEEYDPELHQVLRRHWDRLPAVIDVDRVDTDRVRKDLVKWSVFRSAYGFFFPELFELVTDPGDPRFLDVDAVVVAAFVRDVADGYDPDTSSPTWFDQLRHVAEQHRFAIRRQDFKADPSAFHGTMKEASNIVRVAVTGSGRSPSLDQVCGILGADEVLRRLGSIAG